MGSDPFDGPYHHLYGGFPGAVGGAGAAGPTLAIAALTVLWLAALTWLLWPWIRSRFHAPAQQERPVEGAELESVELLRQRYVLGQIDAFTFEDMLDHLLVSQAREQEFYRKEALARAARWERYHPRSGEAPQAQPSSLGDPIAGDGYVPSPEELESGPHPY